MRVRLDVNTALRLIATGTTLIVAGVIAANAAGRWVFWLCAIGVTAVGICCLYCTLLAAQTAWLNSGHTQTDTPRRAK